MFAPKTGLVVEGYELRRCVGRGGFGVVYQAKHVDDGRVVAMKLMRPPTGNRATTVGRFRREIAIVQRLKHPRIVKIYQSGEIGEDALYYAMEFLDGDDLSDALALEGALNVGVAVEIATQVLEALVVAHDAGVIHRDIKPANIFLQRGDVVEPDVKVLDFGIATMPDDPDQDTLTGAGRIVGTPKYMAPETVMEAIYSPASDVYAVGLVVLEMLRGAPVFDGDVQEILRAQALHSPEMPAEIESTRLQWWLEKCLSKDPDFRHADASVALAALRSASAELADLSGSRLSDKLPMPHDTVQVVLSAGDRAALVRTLDESSASEKDEATVSKIVSVGEMDEARWFADTVNSVEQPALRAQPPPAVGVVTPGSEHETPQTERVAGKFDFDVETAPLPDLDGETAPLPDIELARPAVLVEPDDDRPAGNEERPPPPPANRSRVFGAALLAFATVLALVMLGRTTKETPFGVDGIVRFRVESEPPAAFFTIDQRKQGRTPQVMEWAAADFPIVIDFHHPNGGTATEVVSTPTPVVSVTLSPPLPSRTRPDSEPSEPRELSDREIEEEVRAKVKRGKGFDVSGLFSSDPVNQEIVFASAEQFGDSFEPTTPSANGTWWSDTQKRLTELARPCLQEAGISPPDPDAPRQPLVAAARVTVTGGGRVAHVKAESFGRARPPPARAMTCIEERVLEQWVPPPPRRVGREESIPLLF